MSHVELFCPQCEYKRDQWVCLQCGRRVLENVAQATNYICEDCQQPFFDQDGNQHINPETVLPSIY